MKKYLTYDAVNCEYEQFNTVEEVREHLVSIFLSDEGDGYDSDMEGCKIFKLFETVKHLVDIQKAFNKLLEEKI